MVLAIKKPAINKYGLIQTFLKFNFSWNVSFASFKTNLATRKTAANPNSISANSQAAEGKIGFKIVDLEYNKKPQNNRV